MVVLPRSPLIYVPGGQVTLADPFNQALVAYWPCNEGTGRSISEIRGLDQGLYSGTPANWEESPYGPAVKLDGSTNWINVPFRTGVPFDFSAPPISFAMWLYWRASTEAYNTLAEYYSGATPAWVFLLKSNQLPAVYDGPGADPLGSTTVPFNQWSHLAFTDDPAGNLTFYLNGVAVATAVLTSSSANPHTDLTIGKSGAGLGAGRFLNGSIRDVGIWKRALSSSEVRELYDVTRRPPAKWRLFWRFTPAIQTLTGATGIPSEEAFGAGGFVGDIVGTTGIPSAEVFGAGGQVNVGAAQSIGGGAGIPSA